MSKTFVSLSVLKLVEQGKLKFEDTVRQLAPEVWFENDWESTDPIRIVNLLEHTTGWDDMHFHEYAKIPQPSPYSRHSITTIIRAYVTRNLQKPALPPHVTEYTGWYEPNSPRVELIYFLERLLGLAHIDFEDNKLLITSISEKNATPSRHRHSVSACS